MAAVTSRAMSHQATSEVVLLMSLSGLSSSPASLSWSLSWDPLPLVRYQLSSVGPEISIRSLSLTPEKRAGDLESSPTLSSVPSMRAVQCGV